LNGFAQPLALAAAAMLLGAVAGSFLATVLIRWPQGRSALRGRSRCDACDARLGPFELVPLLSWAVQRGRCRRCGAPIDPRHVAVELAAAAIGIVAIIAHPLPLAPVTAAFGWWLLLIAALDLEHHWLPDALTLPLVPLGLAAAWAGFGPPLAERAAAAAIGWAALASIAWAYRALRGRDGMGAGDPRLITVAGLIARAAAPGTLFSIEGFRVNSANAGGLSVPEQCAQQTRLGLWAVRESDTRRPVVGVALDRSRHERIQNFVRRCAETIERYSG